MVRIRDIPLNVQEGPIRAILRKFEEIVDLRIKKVEMWQTATVTYRTEEQATELSHRWAIPFAKEYLRVLPVANEEEINRERSRYVLKITNLPAGATAYNLEEVADNFNAKTIYIPRTPGYFRERFAFMAFETIEDLEKAREREVQMARSKLRFVEQFQKTCY